MQAKFSWWHWFHFAELEALIAPPTDTALRGVVLNEVRTYLDFDLGTGALEFLQWRGWKITRTLAPASAAVGGWATTVTAATLMVEPRLGASPPKT